MFKHLTENNITYIKHFKQASFISLKMLYGSISCAIHAIYPDIFKTTGSDIAREIVKIVDKDKLQNK